MAVEKFYKVVKGDNIEEFQEEISHLLTLGYQLSGNLVVNSITVSNGAAFKDSIVLIYHQSLYKSSFTEVDNK